MVELPDISGRHYALLNCAIVFSADEQAYQDVIALISSVKGTRIFYTKASRLRLVVNEQGFH